MSYVTRVGRSHTISARENQISISHLTDFIFFVSKHMHTIWFDGKLTKCIVVAYSSKRKESYGLGVILENKKHWMIIEHEVKSINLKSYRKKIVILFLWEFLWKEKNRRKSTNFIFQNENLSINNALITNA